MSNSVEENTIYTMIPKTGKVKLACNYRSIALICRTSKILRRIIIEIYEGHLRDERRMNVEFRACFIDYSNAFDVSKIKGNSTS